MATNRPSRPRCWRPPAVEELEPRIALSLFFPSAGQGHAPGDALAGEAARGGPGGFRLDIVALHELGHSLGLGHVSNPSSIMYPSYNAGYSLENLAGDPVIPTLQNLYANVDTSPWRDDRDGANDGVIDLTYSFMPTGVSLDSGQTNTALPAEYQATFVAELNRWGTVLNASTPTITFTERSDAGHPFNYSGASQNDPDSGDVRIGAHKFDRAGGTLAHAYFPPPNGATAAGDTHLDTQETWLDANGNPLPDLKGGAGKGGGGKGKGNGKGNQDSGLTDARAEQVALGLALVRNQDPAGANRLPSSGAFPPTEATTAGQTSLPSPTSLTPGPTVTGSGTLVGSLPAAALSGGSTREVREALPDTPQDSMPENPEEPATPSEEQPAPRKGTEGDPTIRPDRPADRTPTETLDALFLEPAGTVLPRSETDLHTSVPPPLSLTSVTGLVVMLGGCWHTRPASTREEERG